jgi:flagellar motor switch protein FliN/FliY
MAEQAPADTEVKKAELSEISAENTAAKAGSIDMLMDVSLDVTIELGRTMMSIKDILNLSVGSVIELDKMAGDPVDILVNNKLIARGEVVVIDENFGVRITEIISTQDRIKDLG